MRRRRIASPGKDLSEMNEMETDAQKVLRLEAEAILDLIPRIDADFDAAVEMILQCQGRVVMTGMGKSGIIARKISATLASTGTPSFYLHPAEGIHGDLGMVTTGDVVIALSNSGETGEVLNILPSLRRIGAKLIAMIGNSDSTLAKNSDVVLNVGVKQEACPLGLAPTASTTAALAFGDALAIALMGKHHFTSKQFAVSIRAAAWVGSYCLRWAILCTAAMKIRWWKAILPLRKRCL